MVNTKLNNLYLDSDTVLDDGNTDSPEDDGQPRIKKPPVEPTEEPTFEEDENPDSNPEEYDAQ